MISDERLTAGERVFIALGSNLGDRANWLHQARAKLSASPTMKIIKASALYETGPVGKLDQPAFLNQVIEIRSTRSPEDLLRRLLKIEKELGRVRQERWGPRNIDLDLLAFGARVVTSDHLTLPHPELQRRRFVLAPWAEIAPEFEIAGFSSTVAELLQKCDDHSGVQKIELEPLL